MDISRFDDGRVLDAIIAGLIAEGCDLDDLDVQLSLHGPVDLDLLQECLARRGWHGEPANDAVPAGHFRAA